MNDQLNIVQASDPENLKNILEVVRYLRGLDRYKVSQAAVYRHRDHGKFGPQPDGSFKISDVERYAETHLRRKDGSAAPSTRPTAIADDKASAEARKVAAQAEHWEIKTRILKGEYIERSAFEAALARRAAIIKSDVENFIRSNSAEMIKIVTGDDLRATDLIDFWISAAEKWLARYSEDAKHELPAAIDPGRLQELEA